MIAVLTEMYSKMSGPATIYADIRFAGSTEYSARAFLIDLVCKHINKQQNKHFNPS